MRHLSVIRDEPAAPLATVDRDCVAPATESRVQTELTGKGFDESSECDLWGLSNYRVMRLEAEFDFEFVSWGGSGVFDGRDVDRFRVLGDGCPVCCGDLMVVLDRDLSVGDASEGGCDAEVVDESLPRSVVVGGVVEVAFESVCLMTPHSATCGPCGYPSEDVEVELGGMVGES